MWVMCRKGLCRHSRPGQPPGWGAEPLLHPRHYLGAYMQLISFIIMATL